MSDVILERLRSGAFCHFHAGGACGCERLAGYLDDAIRGLPGPTCVVLPSGRPVVGSVFAAAAGQSAEAFEAAIRAALRNDEPRVVAKGET